MNTKWYMLGILSIFFVLVVDSETITPASVTGYSLLSHDKGRFAGGRYILNAGVDISLR